MGFVKGVKTITSVGWAILQAFTGHLLHARHCGIHRQAKEDGCPLGIWVKIVQCFVGFYRLKKYLCPPLTRNCTLDFCFQFLTKGFQKLSDFLIDTSRIFCSNVWPLAYCRVQAPVRDKGDRRFRLLTHLFDSLGGRSPLFLLRLLLALQDES